MSVLKPLIYLLLFVAVSCSTSKRAALSEVELRSRVLQVRVGMSHSEVVSLLPVFSEPRNAFLPDGSVVLLDRPIVCTITGAGQVEAYRVSPEWMVYVPYDHSKPNPRVKGSVKLKRISK